jgi:2-polyprenyl-6-methoxyphenol hydroxylase-like FAD-dependent oxidoreductase
MRVIAIGGSVTGLAAAAALADRGHEVLVLERESTEPPATLAAAADGWARPTVPQAAHSHAFGSRGTNILRDRLPDVYAALVEAGAGEVNLADFTPPQLGPVERIPSDDLLNDVRRSSGCCGTARSRERVSPYGRARPCVVSSPTATA